LLRDFQDSERPTPQIVAISYSWLSYNHPDPEGFHLNIIGPLLRHFANKNNTSTHELTEPNKINLEEKS